MYLTGQVKMKKSIPKGVKCEDCGKEIKVGDENVGYWKEENVYRCGECTQAFFKTEVYSRSVGYIRPVQQWNTGKTAEFKDRKMFKVRV